MFTFTVTLEGQSLLESAIAGSHPVLIDSILLTGTGDFSSISPVTSFSGSVIQSSADIGDYVVITFNDDNLNNSYIITNIALRSGLVNIATLEGISIEKEEGKSANYRFSCIFDGANKCLFNNTCIGLPYASKYRDGVIRLARSSDESNKLYTVYSASDVESLIEEAISDSSLFVTWDLDAQSKPINGYTTVSCLTIKNGNNGISLTADSNSNLVVGGTVIASSVSSDSYIGLGIYSSYSENTWSLVGNNSKLPTVLAVRDAIVTSATSITSAYQTADNSLQSQIDALNAGQNLADIVDTKVSLNALPTANLQTGDKVQVLADETHDSASTVYSLTKSGSTSTWTYIGKYGSDSYTKNEANNLFVENSQIKQSVDSAKQDEIPSSSAVASYVTDQISSAALDYVKISSVTSQSIISPLSITGTVNINTVSFNEGTITSNYISSGSLQYSYKLSSASSSDSSFRISQLKGTGTVSTITLDGDDNTITLFNGLGDLILSSSANLPHDINGSLVANYRDVQNGTLSDGRLVTVDYMSSAISGVTPVGVAYLSQDNTFTGNNTFSSGSGSDVKTTTFNSNVVLNTSPTGTGVCSSNSSWASASTQIPTVSVVKYAISESIPTNISYFNNDSGYITSYTETDPTVPSWAKQSTKPSYNLDEISDGSTRILPTKTSDLVNDSGFIISETDPTVPSWAKQSTKPTYTANEVGALPDTTFIPSTTSDLTNTSGFLSSSDLRTINSQSIVGSGDITISGDTNIIESISVNSVAQTVTNKNVNITVPVNTSQLNNDSGFITSYVETDPTVPSWAKQPSKPSYTLDEVTDGANRILPTHTSQLNNDLGFITSIDIPTNVSYFNNDANYITSSDIPTDVSVFNNDIGYITSSSIPTSISDFSNDVGYITSADIPSNISDFNNDAGYITSSDIPTDISDFNNDAGYITLSDIPTIPTSTSQLTNDSGFLISSDFKTINNESIIGSGNISIPGVGGGDIIPSSDNTYKLGSASYKWNHIYVHSLHAWGNSPQYGVVLCDGDYESTAYSSITGYQSGSNGQMKFHHYNAANSIDYVVTSTGPNSTNSSTEATLTTEPQTDNTWTIGSYANKLKAVYSNSLHGLLETLYSSGKGAIYFFKLSITNKSSSAAYTVPRGTSLSDPAYFTTNSSATALLYINSYEERVDDTSASYGTATFSGTFYTLMRFKVDAGASSKSVYVPCLRIS